MNLAIHIDRDAPASLQDQLFEQLRQMIMNGRLKPNARLIATRFLAEQAGVSRTTVLLAYERLISEGYLETRPTVGTFVSANPPALEGAANVAVPTFERTSASPATKAAPPTPAFDFGRDATDGSNLLSERALLLTIRTALADRSCSLGGVQPAEGLLALREAIAERLTTGRGLMVSPEQVLIVGGRRQALSLAAHATVRRGDRVVLDWACEADILDFFRARGADKVFAAADADGLRVDRLPDGPTALAFVTPSRQGPFGVDMSLQRRAKLLGWANRTGAFIVEDECDAELRYHGAPPPPLANLDGAGRVFYVGSFAKTLGAAMGLGYLVVPHDLVERVLAIKAMTETNGAVLEQMVLARMLRDGGYDHHLRRVRRLYLERRDALIEAMGAHFGAVRLTGTEIGTELTWLLSGEAPSARAAAERARLCGVRVEPPLQRETAPSADRPFDDKALVLSYAGLGPQQIRQGVARLARALGR
jgi:GntR family transcriptional regulator/MocR family aminotransferase